MVTESQMQELYDKQKLHENLMLYVRGVDRQDTELMKATYWPDSTDDHGHFIGPGHEWAEYSTAWRTKVYNVNHHVSNVLIELKGNQAERESMFMCVVTWKKPALSTFLGGRYRDLCEKRDGEWKILNRVCVWDWFEHRPTSGGFEICDIPQITNWGAFYPEDPVYKSWDRGFPTQYDRPIETYRSPLEQDESHDKRP